MKRLAVAAIVCAGAVAAPLAQAVAQAPAAPAGPAAGGSLFSGKEPIDTSADSQERAGPDHIILKGNVEVVQGQARLRSPQIDLFTAPSKTGPQAATATNGMGNIQRIEAEGPVYYVTPTQSAKGDHGQYLADGDQIILTGNVILTQGPNVSTGDRLVIHQKTSQAVLTSGAGKRTRGVFYPNAPAAPAPAAKPAPSRPARA